jgi:hypothetical protein
MFQHFPLRLEYRHKRSDGRCDAVGAELGRHEALYASFDSRINHDLLDQEIGRTDDGDDSVLTFEGFDETSENVLGTSDGDIFREGTFAGWAGDDSQVECFTQRRD